MSLLSSNFMATVEQASVTERSKAVEALVGITEQAVAFRC